jgi:hypothetical protein
MIIMGQIKLQKILYLVFVTYLDRK